MTSRVLLAVLILHAVCLPLRAQKVEEQRDARKSELRFERIEQAVRHLRHSQRHQCLEQIWASALLAKSLSDDVQREAWREKLWGDGTVADTAYQLFRQLLDGELENPFDLFDALPYAKWYTLALATKKGTSHSPAMAQRRGVTTTLHLLSLCSASTTSTYAKQSVRVLTSVQGEERQALLGILKSASRHPKHAACVARLCAHLRYSMRYRRLTDPAWCRFLVDISTTSSEAIDILRSLRETKDDDLATDVALRTATKHPVDGQIQTYALDTLLRTREGERALALALDAEANIPYPAKRAFRTHYFRTLRYDLYRTRDKLQIPKGMLTYREEREERRYAASWEQDLEAQMALADLYAVERKTEDAVDLYRDVCLRASDTGMVWSAWAGWAELSPDSAWHHRHIVDEIDRFPEYLPVATNEFLGTVFGTIIAAEDLYTAVAWASERINSPQSQLQNSPLAALLAALTWIRDDGQRDQVFPEGRDAAFINRTAASIVNLSQGSTAFSVGMPSGMATLIRHKLDGQFDGHNCWVRATRLLLDAIPSYDSGANVATAWQSIARACPREPDATDRELYSQFNAACLAWIDARQDDATAMDGLLRGVAYHAYQGHGHQPHQKSADLFLPLLERAAAQELPSLRIRTAVSYLLKGFAKAKADDQLIDETKAAILRHYPDLAETLVRRSDL